VKRYWEIIADNLSKAGWSWGCVSAIDAERRTIWIALTAGLQKVIAQLELSKSTPQTVSNNH